MFYEVWVSSSKYHGNEPLTYSSENKLKPGAVVIVPIRSSTALGIIKQAVPSPTFTTKPIQKALTDIVLPKASLELLMWLQQYYPAPLGSLTQLFLPAGLLREKFKPVEETNLQKTLDKLPILTAEQKTAFSTITTSVAPTFFIHGDTGTGKTRLYLELAKNTLKTGKSVLILTPEIGLTPQLIKSFEQYLQETVVTIHSHLTETERRTTWLEVLNAKKPLVVIGPRSALFSPFQNLGLIVVDEAHESAYKQEQMPHYQALRVASKLAQLQEAKLVLGTATPLISEYYFAETKNVPIIRLTTQALKPTADSTITVVNLRDRQNFTRQYYLSDQLLKSIGEALTRKEQSLVFLNRRGTARLVLCQACGWQALCPNCDLPLTYHGDNHILRCHTCGYKTLPPTVCEICKSTDINFKSIGTKALVEALQKEFGGARIQRFDTDNLKAERLEEHYSSVHSGDVDIIVGTQLITKGLDLPRLSTLGVVLADSSLYFPDYTAEEHTYQLLSQVLGRVGRGHVARAEAIVQTYHPDSPAIVAATTKDWAGFYKSQLEERKKFLFPPFVFALKLVCERSTSSSAKQAAEKLLGKLRHLGLKIRFIGPAPSFQEKINGKYRWQIIAKAKNRGSLLELLPHLPSGWTYDIDPTNLL